MSHCTALSILNAYLIAYMDKISSVSHLDAHLAVPSSKAYKIFETS